MNPRCSIALLESALAGSLPVDDEASLHRHLEVCDECSTALERLAGGPAWCQEAAVLLRADELDAAVPIRDEWSEVDFTVEHLEPADEPNVLGRLGGYDVLAIIGHGGMGVVLKAFDRELKRPVAIKVLAPHLAQNSLARKRFAREAQAAAAVVHPHVLAIHQVQAGGRLPYLVMPLVAGESLADRLTAQGTLELKEILRIGMQAAAGLAAAHEQGLVHRDVKPANILLEKGVERAVLTDFGLARAADDVALTRWGIIAGTPQYMSPEQARGEPLDGRSDLFSLGCVLYEMATGVSPFRTDSVMATLRRLVDDAPQAMASLNPELPSWFIGIVDRLLEKDPSRRFNSAREVSELLEGCLAHVQQPASVPLPAALPKPALRGIWPFNISMKGVLAMTAASIIGLFGMVLLSATPPDIAGQWSGEEWGQVVLKKTSDGEYTGTYTDTYGKQPGEIQLKWSRIERRFYGTWREGENRFGELSVRLVGDEIRGAHTTDAKSKINPATPRLADLAWIRAGWTPKISRIELNELGALSHRVPFEVGATYLRGGDRITIDEIRGTADTIKAGNMYEIKGTYRLASRGKATLAAYITDDGTAEKAQRSGEVPTLRTQSMSGVSGEGSFVLILYVWQAGKPHVSLYSDDGEGFGHVYFGTGDSVLKKGWWERPGSHAAAGEFKEATFGPVFERDARNREAIDFDTGKLAMLPGAELNPEKGLLWVFEQRLDSVTAWMDEQKMDALGGEGTSLVAFGLKVNELTNADWNTMAPSALADALNVDWEKVNPREFGKAIHPIDPKARPHAVLALRTRPRTIAFQTREGGMGILQLVETTKAGLKVRYKLVNSAGTDQSESKRQRFEPLEGQADKTNWAVFQPPSFFSQTDWAVMARMTIGGEARIQLPKDTQPRCIITLQKGTDDAITVQVQDAAKKSTTVVSVTRDQSAEVTVDGAGYNISFASVWVALKDPDTSPFAQVIVRRVENQRESDLKDETQAKAASAAPKLLHRSPADARTEPLVLVGHVDWVTGVAFSPDGKSVASSSRDGALKVWNAATGQEQLTLKRTTGDINDGHGRYVQAVAFSPDGKYLASAGDDKTVYVWNAITGRALAGLARHTSVVTSVAYNPDGTRLASASSDNTIKIWDASPQADKFGVILSLEHPMAISVSFSPDGKRLASAGRDNMIRVWNPISGELQLTMAQSDQVTGVVFSPDGKRLASAGPSGVQVWDASTGKVVFALKGLTGTSGVTYSPDGKRLATAGWDHLIKLWDPATGRELLTLQGHGNTVGSMAFSPDGKQLASASSDRTVRVWNATIPDDVDDMPTD